MKSLDLCLLVTILLLMSCAGNPNTATPQLTDTLVPISTKIPPTFTPLPTYTPYPTPTSLTATDPLDVWWNAPPYSEKQIQFCRQAYYFDMANCRADVLGGRLTLR